MISLIVAEPSNSKGLYQNHLIITSVMVTVYIYSAEQINSVYIVCAKSICERFIFAESIGQTIYRIQLYHRRSDGTGNPKHSRQQHAFYVT